MSGMLLVHKLDIFFFWWKNNFTQHNVLVQGNVMIVSLENANSR